MTPVNLSMAITLRAVLALRKVGENLAINHRAMRALMSRMACGWPGFKGTLQADPVQLKPHFGNSKIELTTQDMETI